MNPTLITVMQGDYGYNLNFTLQDANGAVVNLTGNTGILFRVQIAAVDLVKFASAITVDSLTLGTCHYTPVATDFDVQGTYDAEIQVTYAGQVITFDNIVITVIPKIPH